MKKYIMCTISEISLKGKNIRRFKKILLDTITNKLKNNNLNYQMHENNSRIFLYLNEEENINIYIEILKKIIGISWIYIGYRTSDDEEEIEEAISKLISFKNPQKYRINAKVYQKKKWTSSRALMEDVARYINHHHHLKVDLTNFDFELSVKVFSTQEVLIFTKYTNGINGLTPLSSGNGLVLLSGGIDSPVASFLMQARGMNNDFITFLTPFTKTEETISKIKKLAEKLNEYNAIDGKLFIVDFSLIQETIKKNAFENYRIVLLRRAFIRFSEFIAKEINASALITGESLGQVASQTLEAQSVINEVSKLIVFKPLIGLNKIEIIKKATNIETLEISNLPGDDMCSNFTPQSPVIKPKLDKVLLQESWIDDYDEKAKITWETMTQVIELGNLKKDGEENAE